jgi:tetratricopeptide (TPR) repeat protein
MIKTPMRKSSMRLAGILIAAMPLLAGCVNDPAARLTESNKLYVDGAMAYQEGDKQRAMAALQIALQQNPDLIMARFLLGNIHKDRGEYAAALVDYKRVAELDPYVYSNHYNVGLMHHLLNQLQEAAAAYIEALRLNTRDAKSSMNLALVYTALGKPEQGLSHAQRAVEIDPRSPEAYANLAVVLDSLGDYPAAETAYRRSIELDPKRVETMVNLAGCLAAQRRFKDAVAVYDQVTKSTESTLIRQRFGYALLGANRPDDAIIQFQQAIKLNPRNFHAYNGVADAMIAQYRLSSMLDETKRIAAVGQWKKSLEINPDQAGVQALVKEYSQGGL